MSPRSCKRLITLAVALAAMTVSAARADVITTIPSWDGSQAVGAMSNQPGAVTTIGQTFTAVSPNLNVLNSFTFLVKDNVTTPAFDFFARVYNWTGSAITGPAIFTSGPLSVSGLAYQPITVNTGALNLVSGQQYVALFTAIGTVYNGSSANLGSVGTGAGAAYTGGKLIYSDAPTFASLESNTPPRLNFAGDLGDLAFSLAFASVPEPSPVALAAVASLVCGAPVAIRRRLKARKTA